MRNWEVWPYFPPPYPGFDKLADTGPSMSFLSPECSNPLSVFTNNPCLMGTRPRSPLPTARLSPYTLFRQQPKHEPAGFQLRESIQGEKPLSLYRYPSLFKEALGCCYSPSSAFHVHLLSFDGEEKPGRFRTFFWLKCKY